MEGATFHDIPTNFISSQQENFKSSEVSNQLRTSTFMNGKSMVAHSRQIFLIKVLKHFILHAGSIFGNTELSGDNDQNVT